ncbi:MAG TPA: PIN domain-containing protein [Thermoanaerobaculia bacterium]|nr:PIN domain-containing protein [Thermoanaerobaculia bacterium]
MAVLIDTSVAVAAEREHGRVGAVRARLGDQTVAMSAMTASELLHGVHRADTALRRERRLRFVEAILDSVSVLPFDLETARVHSRIWADLSARGQVIGAHDLIIAATALAHVLPIATLNPEHFERVEGLEVRSC